MDLSLETIIRERIDSKREGQYWDFKETHHENKAELLHDILCLSNSLYKGEKYLIYGVSDPFEGCKIKGVKNDNRRSQADLIDFIRSLPFAGDIRPEIELRTIEIQNCILDVLIIFDHPRKPYYLREDYRDRQKLVKANSIYTRNIDTNTPIGGSSDLITIELMWRERFGLDIQPGEKIIDLLCRPQEWDRDIGNRQFAYHKFHPEYQIEFSDTREFKEAFSYFYSNSKSYIGTAKFKYLSTELFQLPYMYCDEMRIVLAVPTNGYVKGDTREVWYMYYELESRNGAFLHFLTNGTFNFFSRTAEAAFVLYRNRSERKEFEKYLSIHTKEIDQIPDPEFSMIKFRRLEESDKHFISEAIEMTKIAAQFRAWRNRKDSI